MLDQTLKYSRIHQFHSIKIKEFQSRIAVQTFPKNGLQVGEILSSSFLFNKFILSQLFQEIQKSHENNGWHVNGPLYFGPDTRLGPLWLCQRARNAFRASVVL
jgi:hypothetical protein